MEKVDDVFELDFWLCLLMIEYFSKQSEVVSLVNKATKAVTDKSIFFLDLKFLVCWYVIILFSSQEVLSVCISKELVNVSLALYI